MVLSVPKYLLFFNLNKIKMKIKFLLFFTLLSGTFYGQFPAHRPELLINKEVRILPLGEGMQKFGYNNLHKTENMNHLENPIKYENVVGKIFTVVSTTPYTKNGKVKYNIKLNSPQNGTLFYDYETDYDFNYILQVIGGLKLPNDLWCDKITQSIDKFTGVITARTPFSEGFCFIKVLEGGSSTIYLTVNEIGSTLNVGKKGFVLLLADGSKIEKPNEVIDVKVNIGGKGYLYNAFVRLSEDDIEKLLKSEITDNRLYLYDGSVKDGKKLQSFLTCIVK